MNTQSFEIVDGITIGDNNLPVLISGPCVIENEEMTLRHAEEISRICTDLSMPFIFKASYDKANRTSINSYRGPGLAEGLRILNRVKTEIGVPVLTDAHSVNEITTVSEVVDIVQIPAFLCRQTDLLIAAAKTGLPVNIKKGQFIAPEDIKPIIEKVVNSGGKRIMITERGSSFGYNKLVVDFTGIVQMRKFGFPVIFDATHSVQQPGGLGNSSGGDGKYAPYLAYAAAGVGIDGLFLEVHKNPSQALSDGPNMIPLDNLKSVLERFLRIASINYETSVT
ncbi:MAG: 3-deoxy-8-phosphooctulonate synthase [Candidatus Hatepunaea meridiana]|nr:3-deoxy-8-phosphooctulonate synthase [Candidatus Hatepunaea meridiana]